MIKLYLFGSLQLFVNDKPVSGFRSDKTRALLAYLALNRNQPITRTALAQLLWDGYQVDSALANLRMTLSNLRQVLAPYPLVEANRQTIQLHCTPTQFWCDALAPDWLTYFAEHEQFFLGGEHIDSVPFQRWLQEQRAYYQGYAQQHQALKPRAKTPLPVVPNNLRRLLTPLIGRTQEFDRLRALVTQTEHALLTLVGEGGIGKTRLALAIAQASTEWPLPTESTTDPALSPEQLSALPFPDGVWFVPLAGIAAGENLANHLAAAIGEAMHYQFSGSESVTDQLCVYLQHKRALLILDNFEQLTDGADWLLILLQKTTALKILVTSRQRLNLEAEAIFRLHGLTTPGEEEIATLAEATLHAYGSTQLFLHRAERTTHDFQLTRDNALDIARICHFVGGLPLGIVLASTLLERYSCAQIVALLEENYTVLAAALADLPPRQRSIQAVLDTSWQLLTEAEQAVLTQCAIFRGSFSLEAALAVTEGTPSVLARLEAKSLLRMPSTDRYEMHELVRQYAAGYLRSRPDMEHQARDRHSAYYLQLVGQQGDQLRQSAQAQYRIREELENVRNALAWAVTHVQVDRVAAALPTLAHFYGLAGLQQEAALALAQAVAYFRGFLDTTVPAAPLQRLFTTMLLEQAYFQLNLAQPNQAAGLVEEALRFIPLLADPELEIRVKLRQGDIAWSQGNYEGHRVAYTESLALAQAWGWQQMIAHSLTNLGMNHDVRGEYAAAIGNYQAALTIAQQVEHRQQMNIIYNNLGVSHQWLGDLSAALHYYQQTLAASRALADQEGVGVAHLNLGIVLMDLGDWENAQEHLEKARKFFHLGGHQRLEAKALVNLATLNYDLAQDQSAEEYAQQALHLVQQSNLQSVAAETFTVIGDGLRRRSHYAEAIANYQTALERWHSIGNPHRIARTQSGLALSLLGQGEQAKAQQIVEQLLLNITNHNNKATHSFVFLTCYEVFTAVHDERAASILALGQQIVEQQAAAITDPILRAKFLTNVPSNHKLLATSRPLTKSQHSSL